MIVTIWLMLMLVYNEIFSVIFSRFIMEKVVPLQMYSKI